jgi:hypothetical protein
MSDNYDLSSLAFGKRPNGFRHWVIYQDGKDPLKVFCKSERERDARVAKAVKQYGIDCILELGDAY